MTKAPKKTEPVKLQQTVQVKEYGDDDMNRFAVVIMALQAMDERQRSAALGYIKATWPKEWPSDAY